VTQTFRSWQRTRCQVLIIDVAEQCRIDRHEPASTFLLHTRAATFFKQGPSIHPSTPPTKRSGGDSDSRKDIQSGAASNAVVRAAAELPVAARPAWRC
jgi:hypothetical protein